LQTPDLTYAAGLPTSGNEPHAGAPFIKFLAGPSGEAIVKAKGLVLGDGG
jgi:hypothetical protein